MNKFRINVLRARISGGLFVGKSPPKPASVPVAGNHSMAKDNQGNRVFAIRGTDDPHRPGFAKTQSDLAIRSGSTVGYFP